MNIATTFYITGTDTDAGKTWASVALIEAVKGHGHHKVIGMKPIASGCMQTENGLRNDDALKLQAASNVHMDYSIINPYALLDATAPEIAAARQNIRPSLTAILNAYHLCSQRADIVFIEGAGGWLAPLSADIEQVDLVRAVNCPVILIVGMKLGCINHARLTERALLNDGVQCLGWISAEVDPHLPFAHDYFKALERQMQTPLLGRLWANQNHELDGLLELI
jgi:dethiobiotin synthetase